MDQDEAIAVAEAWVKERYSEVPTIARVFQYTDDFVGKMLSEEVMKLNPRLDNDEFRSEVESCRGKWAVWYQRGIRVLIDPETRHAEVMK
jgi:hypothetical protein